jgi:excisionase family DNA binding protein
MVGFVMTVSESLSGNHTEPGDVLTLTEAAAYLRVEQAALERLVGDEAIPARKIGGEWRFLKKALDDWLRFPGRHPRDYWMMHPPWLLDSPFAEDLLLLLEKRLLKKLEQAGPRSAKPGSKQAVLTHMGIFRDDDDLEARLADARARREAGG